MAGAVSPTPLSEIGCTHVKVGHAERRGLFQEEDDHVGFHNERSEGAGQPAPPSSSQL